MLELLPKGGIHGALAYGLGLVTSVSAGVITCELNGVDLVTENAGIAMGAATKPLEVQVVYKAV